MKILNVDGVDGPSLIKIFSCDNCKYLGNASVAFGGLPYKCYHNDIVKNYKSTLQMFNGDISYDKITPDYCPFLFKKMLKEKLEEINNNLNDK